MSSQYPERKHIRLPNFDYGHESAYFITICAHKRQPLFGGIQRGIMCLNALGALVWEEWQKTFVMRPNFISNAFIVMPNHLHALFTITREPGDEWNPSRIEAFSRPSKDTTAAIIRGTKSAITSAARKSGLAESDVKLWQSRYWDHVVRDWQEYDRIYHYIRDNPRCWRDDCFH